MRCLSIKRITDFDKLDNFQKYMILQNAKELLAYLNDSHEAFPYDLYMTGSETLLKAMGFVDSVIHGEIE